ncbi:dihydrolipoamide acetyltransferase family protein [Streptomyces jeddahensis]|uniref:Dihydrolipoamide acetyltransferase component of pyruvate dehydrogenase complex n=1 Tax=Streptomyces jeddahensis TaxID=1716141 RepID=A0A177HW71_9ACTN|nr:dihydrolipoamide acetyltransferase family protein [Streptomyces jeddahensis]OAH14930.1 lipoamide acyltransferase component of branched-chain alpha-keto acid dehydrogenase complex [Streptomyces jeddahensis]
MAQASEMHSLEFRLPDLGEGLTEAEIVHWLVEVGDLVAVDQPVVEVETAKAMIEVPCPYAGVVTARFGEEGTELPVGAPLLTVAVGAPAAGAAGAAGDGAAGGGSAGGEPGESVRGAGSGGTAPVGARPSPSPRPTPSPSPRPSTSPSPSGSSGLSGSSGGDASGNVLVGYGTGAAPARRRRVRPAAPSPEVSPSLEQGVPPSAAEAQATSGAPVRDEGPVPVMSPLVRKLAREHGLDLHELAGSGPDGLITRADVEDAVRAAGRAGERPRTGLGVPAPGETEAVRAGRGLAEPAEPAVLQTGHAPAAEPVAPGAGATASGIADASGVRVPLRGVRGAVADKLSRSRREIPDATCWVDADATELMQALAAMRSYSAQDARPPETGGQKISLLALLARICTAALARHPELNSKVDMEAREIVQLDRVHLGFAAQTDRGLVVPVVRDAHTRNAESLSAEIARLTESARAGTLTPGELTGGTFTLNNYGVFGVDGSTPIINHPEAAMLGVGRIAPKPWVHQGELAVRKVVQLSLTFDHRVCDGGTAGGFLRYVADCVEQPAVLLRTL